MAPTSFHVEKGNTLGLLGPNGAGKSSMLSMMSMDLKTTQGDIKLINTLINSKKMIDHGKVMGIVPQYDCIYEDLTVNESLIF